MTDFTNTYEDEAYANAYSSLEFPGSYYLAYRDLPSFIKRYVSGSIALDFGCGTGRSTRFLQELQFQAVGIDISENMIRKAREIDPDGDYRLVKDDDYSVLKAQKFDLVLSVFTFDNIPDEKQRVAIMKRLRDCLHKNGTMILIDATPELYWHETASFSTKDFPENKMKKSGEIVKIIIKDVDKIRPAEDVLWFHEDYLSQFQEAGLTPLISKKIFGEDHEPFEWITEKECAPWVAYFLRKADVTS